MQRFSTEAAATLKDDPLAKVFSEIKVTLTASGDERGQSENPVTTPVAAAR